MPNFGNLLFVISFKKNPDSLRDVKVFFYISKAVRISFWSKFQKRDCQNLKGMVIIIIFYLDAKFWQSVFCDLNQKNPENLRDVKVFLYISKAVRIFFGSNSKKEMPKFERYGYYYYILFRCQILAICF